jgi:hypothetical protein
VLLIEPVIVELPAHWVGVAVRVGVAVAGVPVSVAVGIGCAEQLANLKVPIRVRQSRRPVRAKYSWVYQNVQSSTGSTLMLL